MSKRSKLIAEMVRQANFFLLNSPDDCAGERRGHASMIDSLLSASGNYRGFQYLDARDMSASEKGKSLGIIFDDTPSLEHVYPDPTRRRYF